MAIEASPILSQELKRRRLSVATADASSLDRRPDTDVLPETVPTDWPTALDSMPLAIPLNDQIQSEFVILGPFHVNNCDGLAEHLDLEWKCKFLLHCGQQSAVLLILAVSVNRRVFQHSSTSVLSSVSVHICVVDFLPDFAIPNSLPSAKTG